MLSEAARVVIAGKFLFWAVSISAFWMNCLRQAQGCKYVYWQPVKENHTLENHVIDQIQGVTRSSCQARCFMNNLCRSYNYNTTPCQLSDSDHLEHPSDLVDKPGAVYLAAENACSSKPCDPPKKCFPLFTNPMSYECLDCMPGDLCNAVLCKNAEKVIRCPQGTAIHVTSALFGRDTKNLCGWTLFAFSCGTVDNVLGKMREVCEGKQQCSLPEEAYHLYFGIDPCPGKSKYVRVLYMCT
ncbi:uncharacterized protein LOC5518740 isoform X1 [Nematostella vectensis]|uniref:uncharacterized protein LOC5518740 isoform X1 n=1 Tax=Nematostella vectensis TaxID=45351 RepID=UPI00138FEF63|nr:uncharacterized protein LOC5518740 isoform X1 [Nematostella vectensis]